MLRRPLPILLLIAVGFLVAAWFWDGRVWDSPPSAENGWDLNVDVFGLLGIAFLGAAVGWTAAGFRNGARARRRNRS